MAVVGGLPSLVNQSANAFTEGFLLGGRGWLETLTGGITCRGVSLPGSSLSLKLYSVLGFLQHTLPPRCFCLAAS